MVGETKREGYTLQWRCQKCQQVVATSLRMKKGYGFPPSTVDCLWCPLCMTYTSQTSESF